MRRNAVVKNQGTKQRVQRILGDCWQWESNGQCVKGDNCIIRHDVNKRGKIKPLNHLRILSCSRMSEKHREPEVPEEEVPVAECLDGLAWITSKELAITHFVKSGTVGLGKTAHTHTVSLMNSRLKGPKRMMTKVQ